jgi:hypothetical protein
MTNAEMLRNLRVTLADLYPEREDAVRVAGDAGLNLAYINLGNKPITNWHNILAEAEKQELVGAVVRIARERYPRDKILAEAEAHYTGAGQVPSEGAKHGIPGPDPNLSVLAELLQEAFTADDLRRFCLYRPQFGDVLDGLAPHPSLNELVDALIQFSQTRGRLGELLAEVERERPRQYDRFRDQL